MLEFILFFFGNDVRIHPVQCFDFSITLVSIYSLFVTCSCHWFHAFLQSILEVRTTDSLTLLTTGFAVIDKQTKTERKISIKRLDCFRTNIFFFKVIISIFLQNKKVRLSNTTIEKVFQKVGWTFRFIFHYLKHE